MQLPLRLALQASRSLAILLGSLHLAALGSLLPVDVPLGLKLAGGLAVTLSAVLGIRRHALLGDARAVRALVLRADGSVEAECRSGRFEATVSPHSTVFPWLLVVLLREPGRRRPVAVVVLRDALAAQDWRQLRAWLRWHAVSGA
jgi:toxin CptA